MWQADIGNFPVSFDDQGDEWIYHIEQILCGGDHSMLVEGRPEESQVILERTAGEPRSSLSIRKASNGTVTCTVFGEDGAAGDDQVAPWRDAATRAVTEIGRHARDFTWEAIIGPHPRNMGIGPTGPLAAPVMLGPVSLVPGGIQMRELAGSGQASIDLRGVRYSWPVIASGSVQSYDVMVAEQKAREVVHRACALLSLSWGAFWLPRIGPEMTDPRLPGRPPHAVPQSVGSFDRFGRSESTLPADFNTYKGSDALGLPPWLPGTWKILDSNADLAHAVSVVYEAMSLETDHPSVAYLLHVAAIEHIGKLLGEKEPRQRFLKALETVEDPEDTRKLANFAYGRRSGTGHQGRLFGSETTLGIGGWSFFRPDHIAEFEIVRIRQINNASRRIIANAIRD